jgi:CheY-like chemotaxis protein
MPQVATPASPLYTGLAAVVPRVLVVEDVDTTRRRISSALRARGFRVDEAGDGAQAMRQLSTAKFDAILLDLVMPHVNGWQFREAQLRHPELASIPTIVVTVKPLNEGERYSLRANGFICKPFEDEALVSTVNDVCAAALKAHLEPAAVPLDRKVLFWSRRGEIACTAHAPEPGSERWLSEKWTPIPGGDSHKRILYQCPHCSGRGPINHRTRRNT